MRLLIATICMVFSLAHIHTYGQATNRVLNGNFEYNYSCPSNISEVNACVGWRQYTKGSSDYYDTCATGNADVPTNWGGYQQPASGKSYVGLYTYHKNDPRIYKEYVAGKMIPLVPGSSYEVSMSVSLGNISTYGTNDLGVYFYDTWDDSIATFGPLNVNPHVSWYNLQPIMDSVGWVRLVDTVQVDSAYDNIIIGGFKHYNNLVLDSFPGIGDDGYYLIDSVVVRNITQFVVSVNDTLLCAGDTVHVSYVDLDTSGYSSATTFTLQLSNAAGLFTSPVNIGATVGGTASGTLVGVIPDTITNGNNYLIRLVTSNNADTSNFSDVLKIGNLDTSNIQVSTNAPVCEDQNISLLATYDSSEVSFNWSGPLNYSSTLANPYIVISAPLHSGEYSLISKVYGCTQYDTLNVLVKPKPTIPTVSSNAPVCAGEDLQISSVSNSGASYSWQGPNSYTSSLQNITIPNSITANSGTYTVTATIDGCVNSNSISATVYTTPVNTSSSSNTPLCEGQNISLSSTNNTSGVSYSWTGPNNFTSNSQNPSVSNATTGGSGWYVVTSSINGCTQKDSTNVVVNIVPATPTLSYNNPICVGEALKLTAVSNTSGVSYNWTGPNNFTSTSANPNKSNVSLSDTGEYTLVTNKLNCSSTPQNISIKINTTPFVVMYANKDSICQDEPVTFTALANNASSNLVYQWYINAQAISGANQSTYTNSKLQHGDFVYCKLTDLTKCSMPFIDESNDQQMYVFTWLSPSVSITVNPQGAVHPDSFLTYTAHAIDAGKPKYQWKRNGNDILGATGITWAAKTLDHNDTICVEIESGYQCPQPLKAESNCIGVELLGVGDVENIKKLVLYPNPNNGQFVLEGLLSKRSVYTIEVVNALGQLVYKAQEKSINTTVRKPIELNNIAQGAYLLKFSTDSGYTTLRFYVN